MAKVKEIQVCGNRIATMLSDACLDYLQDITEGTDRPKLHFTIILDNGISKAITFRQEDTGIEVYGDFLGLPSFLDYAKRILHEE